MTRLSEHAVVNIKNKSHAVTAQITVPDGGAQGVIIAQGGSIGGWALYMVGGRLRYCYNLLGVQRFHVGSEQVVPAGERQVRMEFAYDGRGSERAARRPCSSTASRSAKARSARPRR